MPEAAPKRRREKYSKLICHRCRARRIRCALPDTSIAPSSQPQPPDKACHRCQQNGLDCVVDSTTLGRPAEKRNRVDSSVNTQRRSRQTNAQSDDGEFRETSREMEDFLLSHPDVDAGDEHHATTHMQKSKPSRSEIFDAIFSPYHLLSALLSRDNKFASSIGSQPLISETVIEIVPDRFTTVLDNHLVWHRLYYPDIPSLRDLRQIAKCTDRGQSEQPSLMFLLTLLYDIALDVPSEQMASSRYLQPTVRSLLFHTAQQLLFSLSNNNYAVLGLTLAAEYRPLVFTNSQLAAANAVKAVPYTIMAKQIASELEYSSAGSRLIDALQSFDSPNEDLSHLMHECLHWIRLSMAGMSLEFIFRLQPIPESTLQCFEALKTASLLGRMPLELLLPYAAAACWLNRLTSYKDLSENWKDLTHLSHVIQTHKSWCDSQRDILQNVLSSNSCSAAKINAISHLIEGVLHRAHVHVTGSAMFFAVMSGAQAAAKQPTIHPDQAMEISENIIEQLTSHSKEDPTRPSPRRFLEEYGTDRMDQLETVLSNFITAVDTLSLEGIPYVGPMRTVVGFVLFTCKDIVEGNAARLKGWGGLDARVEVQMILFHECARRLESMSASAGAEEALAQGCVLTASAKLVRSLRSILQGFQRSVVLSQRRGNGGSGRLDPSPETATESAGVVDGVVGSSSEVWHGVAMDDMFADWDSWPQFNAFDFTDLFPDVFNTDDADTF